MCESCGCGDRSGHAHHHGHADGVHFHRDADGNLYSHRHSSAERVPLGTAILAANDEQAARLRAYFQKRGIYVLNLISSPGSGKTALLERTLDLLKENAVPAAVIVGDPYGEADAERMRSRCAKVTQIQVHESCHLNASQIEAVLDEAVPEGTKILFIENVGNLVCPVAFDLGENAKIALLSTPEGEEKPVKYPALFAAADVVLLTKSDLADVLGWDRALCTGNIRKVNPDALVIELSARRGTGLEPWIGYLKKYIQSNESIITKRK